MGKTMGPPKPLMDSTPFDDLYTPKEGLIPLLPYLHKPSIIWEMCVGTGQLAGYLKDEGHDVIGDPDKDSLTWEPPSYDIIVTNPPYSNKHKWLARVQELNKPFALLLPVTTLGVRRCQVSMGGVELLLLKRRLDFTGKKAPWFAVCWFTKGLNLPSPITVLGDAIKEQESNQ